MWNLGAGVRKRTFLGSSSASTPPTCGSQCSNPSQPTPKLVTQPSQPVTPPSQQVSQVTPRPTIETNFSSFSSISHGGVSNSGNAGVKRRKLINTEGKDVVYTTDWDFLMRD